MTGGLALSAIPMASAAGLGLGLGLDTQADVHANDHAARADVDADADVAVDAEEENAGHARVGAIHHLSTKATMGSRMERRCTRLSGADREECLRIVALQIAAQGDSELRAETRAAHGRFMSELKAEAHAESDDDDQELGLMARMRLAFREMMMRIQAAFMTEAKASFQVCKEKSGAEREQCLIDAKATLSAKADAAVRAIKGQ